MYLLGTKPASPQACRLANDPDHAAFSVLIRWRTEESGNENASTRISGPLRDKKFSK
jgi:hypothetical protein